MPTGHEFTSDVKCLIFRVIQFVESEKNGPKIPLYNVNHRLSKILGISHGSVIALKKELKTLIEEEEEPPRQKLRSTTQSDQILPKPISPVKIQHSGRPPIILSAFAKEMLRYEFNLLLSEHQYPTLRRLLTSLLTDIPDFPITSISTLSKYLKEIGFIYTKTSSIKARLDSTYFMAERARYFRRLDELRQEKAMIYFHDETWCNKNEEKRRLWVESSTGKGKLRKGEGKGRHLIVNAMISPQGFHLPSVEIFECNEIHSMNADHFTSWIKKTCNMLRTDLENIFPFQGSEQKICLVLDNAPWHNKQTEFSRIPSRSWNKAQIYDWLKKHNVPYFDQYSKAELIELSRANAPPKQYIIDEVATEFDIKILRLPIKRCMLNPTEIAWGGMKNFIRDQNTTFKLEEVRTLASNWLAACDEIATAGFFHHVQKYEETFKKADNFSETIELSLADDADNDTADDDATDDDDPDAAVGDDELKLGIGEEEDEDN